MIDWEAASWGHPFEDLAYFCFAYHYPAELDIMPGVKVGKPISLRCLPFCKQDDDFLLRFLAKIKDRQVVFQVVDSLLAYKSHVVFCRARWRGEGE